MQYVFVASTGCYSYKYFKYPCNISSRGSSGLLDPGYTKHRAENPASAKIRTRVTRCIDEHATMTTVTATVNNIL